MSFNWRLSRCSVAAVAAVALVELPASGGPGTGTTFCPPESQQATEQCGVDVNGGCGAGMQFIDVSCGDVWCGNGWTDSDTRDVDWYLVPLLDPDGDGVGKLTATVVSDFPAVCFLIDGVGPGECNPVVVATGCGDGGLNIEVASATLQAPGSYGVFVAAGDCSGDGIFSGFPCGTQNSYFVSVQCASPCPADLDGDGAVAVTDLPSLLEAWGSNPGGPPDFDGDCSVGILDLLILLGNWGRTGWSVFQRMLIHPHNNFGESCGNLLAAEKAEQKRLRKERHSHFHDGGPSNMLDHSSVKMTEVYAERDYAARALNIAREALGPDHPSVARYAETLRLAKLRD